MTLSQTKELLKSNFMQFTEMEFANEVDFLNHISQFPYTKKAKEHKFYALIIQSNNGKRHVELEYLIEEIQRIMKGNCTIINVTNPKTKRWIADAQFDRNDTDDDMFGEMGFQKAMKRIRKKRTFFERLFGFRRSYEIYDWNTYERIVK